jgi:manganese oxidase
MRHRVHASWIVLAVLLAPACGDDRGAVYKPMTRSYYIAAEDVLWDYAASGRDVITGFAIGDPNDPFAPGPATYLTASATTMGAKNWKALYREYTDETFTTPKPIDPRWAHLGMLGPVIRGVVGDTLVVHFKNNTTRLPAGMNDLSMHPHGVFYDKASEGAPYADYADPAGDAIAPGQTYTYTWRVEERSGPGPADGSSVLWMYHSHVHEVEDTYAGLIGPLIVTSDKYARTNAADDPSPDDVDRELVLMFEVSDESQSSYLAYNMDQFQVRPTDEDAFAESNKKHSINGFVFGNQPLDSVTMYLGERVRWYLFDLGTEVDLHTPHFHGNVVTVAGMQTDLVSLLPGSMLVANMQPDDPGVWLLHCHVNDHIRAGMISRYQVCRSAGDADCKFAPYP